MNPISEQTTTVLMSRRRLMGQMVMGGAAALVLAACGGGGGSDSSDDSRDLEAAFERLKFGMTWEQAKAAVGWAPNSGNSTWTNAGYSLICGIEFPDKVAILATAELNYPGGRVVLREYR